MPGKSLDTQVIEYPMSKLGVNLQKNIVELSPEECSLSKNLIWRNGMIKRGGQSLLNTTQGVSAKKVRGLHRFYYGASKKRLCSIDTKILVDDEDNTWTTLHTFGTAADVTMNTWGSQDKEYIANSTNHPISYDGTTVVDSGASTFLLNSQPTAGQFSEVEITINGVANVGVEGTDWDVGGTTQLTSDDITAWLTSLSGITADNASGASTTITITPAASTDVEAFKWDFKGTDTAAMATVTHFAGPTKAIQFLAYQDRLLSIDDNNAGELRWSKSFVDNEWELRSNTGVRPDIRLYGMMIHSLANADAGFASAVLIAGANSMYLFKATNMIPPATTSGTDYTIYPLSIDVGCESQKTMVWTPKGSMWLGLDRKIYLLPFDSLVPVPVSSKIESNQVQDGVESIPQAQITNATAAYHDGFYKISFAESGQTTNNVQYWLDITRLSADSDGHVGPWYGPMTGQTINILANQNGPGDIGQLMGGESTDFGYIYEVSKVGTRSDIVPATSTSNKEIEIFWQSYYNPLVKIVSGGLEFSKLVDAIELELLDIIGTVTLDFHDIEGSVKTGDSLSLTGGSTKWGSSKWGSFQWSAQKPIRKVLDLSPVVNPRRLAILVKSGSSSANFELYALRARTRENRLVFDGSLNN